MGLAGRFTQVLFRTRQKYCKRHKCCSIISVNNKDIIKGERKDDQIFFVGCMYSLGGAADIRSQWYSNLPIKYRIFRSNKSSYILSAEVLSAY